MPKREVPRRWLAQNYLCYGTGYCELQFLLRFQDPKFYTTGIYGWNFDAYEFDGYLITTGNRGMIHQVRRNSALDREYDDKARQICYNRSLSTEEQKKLVNGLLEEYLKKIFAKEDVDDVL